MNAGCGGDPNIVLRNGRSGCGELNFDVGIILGCRLVRQKYSTASAEFLNGLGLLGSVLGFKGTAKQLTNHGEWQVKSGGGPESLVDRWPVAEIFDDNARIEQVNHSSLHRPSRQLALPGVRTRLHNSRKHRRLCGPERIGCSLERTDSAPPLIIKRFCLLCPLISRNATANPFASWV